ncbi:MAG: hypothetical protein KAH25_10785 [Bacteroidales bacterium]|nr:hypothetical protein [Bacteroidales bacterium]
MSHWIEDAENKSGSKSKKKSDILEKIENKKNDIKSNRLELENDYLNTIELIKQFIIRVNNLPIHERKPFDTITTKQKENKLSNLLYKFSSSRRVLKREFSSILAPFKSVHYKNSRSFFISIAREKGQILLEYKEITAKRVKYENEKKRSFPFAFFSSDKTKEPLHESFQKAIIIPLKSFDEKAILKHIDWLAFKTKTEKLTKTIF